MFSTDKKYQTRDGHRIGRFLTMIDGFPPFGGARQEYAVFVMKSATVPDAVEEVITRKSDGSSFNGSRVQDIIPAVDRTSKLQNVYTTPRAAPWHGSRIEADQAKRLGRVGVLEHQFENGVFVDVVFHRVTE